MTDEFDYSEFKPADPQPQELELRTVRGWEDTGGKAFEPVNLYRGGMAEPEKVKVPDMPLTVNNPKDKGGFGIKESLKTSPIGEMPTQEPVMQDMDTVRSRSTMDTTFSDPMGSGFTGPQTSEAVVDEPAMRGGAGTSARMENGKVVNGKNTLIGQATGNAGMMTGEQAYGEMQDRQRSAEESLPAIQKRIHEITAARDENAARANTIMQRMEGRQFTKKAEFDLGVLNESKAQLDRELLAAQQDMAKAQGGLRAQAPQQGATRSATEAFGSGLAGQMADTMLSGARIAVGVGGAFAPDQRRSANASLDQAHDSIKGELGKNFSPDQTRNEELAQKVAQGGASMLAFVGMGGAARALGLSAGATTMLTGALAQGESGWQDAKRAAEIDPLYAQQWLKQKGIDATPEQANEMVRYASFAASLGIGTTEAMPVAHLFQRLERVSGGSFKRALGIVAASAGEEGLQEFGQTILDNARKQMLLDPNQEITKDVIDSMLVGAITGGGIAGGAVTSKLAIEAIQGRGAAGKLADMAAKDNPDAAEGLKEAINEAKAQDQAEAAGAAMGAQMAKESHPELVTPVEQGAVADPQNAVPSGVDMAAAPNPGKQKVQGQDEPPPVEIDQEDVDTLRAARIQDEDIAARSPAEIKAEAQSLREEHGIRPTTRGKPLDVGKNKQESADSLKAQQGQLASGNRKAVFYPVGTQPAPQPQGAERIQTPEGIYDYDPSQISGQEISELSAQGRGNEILDLGPYDKSQIVERVQQGEKPVTVVERTPDGTEVRAAVGTEQTAPEQIAAMEMKMTDGNTVGIESVDETLAGRDEQHDYSEFQKVGTRSNPVKVETAEDLAAMGSHVNREPTDGQKEAGNYQQGHGVLPSGIRFKQETPAGANRSGTGKDGQRWSVKMEHAYGSFKGTEGADGDQVDGFFGPNPNAKSVFVIDQKDGGNFDEHKVMYGFDSRKVAIKAYTGAFEGDLGRRLIGGVTKMSVDDFKGWLKSGDTKKPLSFKPRQGQKGEAAPKSLLQFLAGRGGLAESDSFRGELKARDLTNHFVPGYGKLVRKGGKDIDSATEAAFEAGYLKAQDTNELLAKLDEELSGRRKFAQADEQTAFDREEAKRTANETRWANEERHNDEMAMKGLADRWGVLGMTDEKIREAVDYADEHGIDQEDALYHIVERMAYEELTPQEQTDVDREIGKSFDSDLGPTESDPFESSPSPAADAGSQQPPARAEDDGREKPQTEIGADGKQQTVIPGAEKASDADMAQKGADAALKPKVPQKDVGGLFGDSMDQADLLDGLSKPAPETIGKKPKDSETFKPENITPTQNVHLFFAEGGSFSAIVEARKFVRGLTTETLTDKQVEEIIEGGVSLTAQGIALRKQSAGQTFLDLLDLYNRQPRLSSRTSTSMELQQYSTPVPLGFVASHLANITRETTVYEPTAGNGLLLMAAAPKNVVANEIDKDRARALRDQEFPAVLQKDATDISAAEVATKANGGKEFDRIIMNPPFGPVITPDGSKVFDMGRFQRGYKTKEMDHAIVFNSLSAMKGEGKAALIIGGPGLGVSEESRLEGYSGKAKREFFLTLYNQYNVVDHFTVDGSLYERQGAGYPVDVIIIDGRGKSALPKPMQQVPAFLSSWDQLKEKIDGQSSGRGQIQDDSDATPVRGGDLLERPRSPDLSGSAGTEAGDLRGTAGPEQSQGVRGEPVRGPEPVRDNAPVVKNKYSEVGERSAGDGNGAIQQGNTDQRAVAPKPDQSETELQVAYTPRSANGQLTALGTLTPTNMRDQTRMALEAIENDVGKPLPNYVAEKLGVDVDTLPSMLAAEQVDGVAAGIYNLEQRKGVIIGDQTGIGKGRQAASMIVHAMRSGKTPVFFTVKPDLYSDMYRDLSDIGFQKIFGREPRILITNANEKFQLDEEGAFTIKNGLVGQHQTHMMNVADNISDHYDMVFTTYNQMSPTAKDNPRRQFMNRLLPNSNLILDESHNAGGTANDDVGQRADGTAKEMNLAAYMQQAVGMASGVYYSSATYAKRPDTMVIYSKTDMSKAVDGDNLVEAIMKGGIPLQQAVASGLAASGQYLRRERSFAGVTYETPVVAVDTEAYDNFSQSMMAIKTFSDLMKDDVKNIDKELKAEAQSVNADNATGGAGAASTAFSSVMHNLINQLLLASKVDATIEAAVAALKRGEKPVIAVANTMESMITQIAEQAGIPIGGPLDVDFGALLLRYLERSRTITIKQPFSREKGIKHYMTDAELSPLSLRAYEQAKEAIRSVDLSSLKLSPLDAIIAGIEAQGYSVQEITGRTTGIDYRGGGAKLYNRSSKDKTTKGKNAIIKGFNSGTTDVVILNQSGATGISLHSSEKFKDQRRRRMIIAQAEGNIDTHFQMMGRVHRTGQVIPPAYEQIVAGVPAEERPIAVLMKKMASLNASTTASRKSSIGTSDAVVDIMNVVGDEIATEWIAENPEIYKSMGEPKANEGDSPIAKLTGYVPLLRIADQIRVLDDLKQRFTDRLAEMDAMGQNPLEAKNLDTQAVIESQSTITEGVPGSNSIFEGPVQAMAVNMKRLTKPYSAQDLLNDLQGIVGIAVAGDLSEGRRLEVFQSEAAKTAFRQYEDAIERAYDKSRDNIASLVSTDAKLAESKRFDEAKSAFAEITNLLSPGARISIVEDEGVRRTAVVLKVAAEGKSRSPIAMSDWSVTIAIAGMGPVRIPMSRLVTTKTESKLQIEPVKDHIETATNTTDIFNALGRDAREKRVFVTGNILKGFSTFGNRGQIVNFTLENGEVRQGIMLPSSIKSLDDALQNAKVAATSAAHLLSAHDWRETVTSNDRLVSINRSRNGDYTIRVNGGRSDGGKYFLNTGVRAITGDFQRRAGAMEVRAYGSRGERAIEAIMAAGAVFTVRAANAGQGRDTFSAKSTRRMEDAGEQDYSRGNVEAKTGSGIGGNVSQASQTAERDNGNGLVGIQGRQDQLSRISASKTRDVGYITGSIRSALLGAATDAGIHPYSNGEVTHREYNDGASQIFHAALAENLPKDAVDRINKILELGARVSPGTTIIPTPGRQHYIENGKHRQAFGLHLSASKLAFVGMLAETEDRYTAIHELTHSVEENLTPNEVRLFISEAPRMKEKMVESMVRSAKAMREAGDRSYAHLSDQQILDDALADAKNESSVFEHITYPMEQYLWEKDHGIHSGWLRVQLRSAFDRIMALARKLAGAVKKEWGISEATTPEEVFRKILSGEIANRGKQINSRDFRGESLSESKSARPSSEDVEAKSILPSKETISNLSDRIIEHVQDFSLPVKRMEESLIKNGTNSPRTTDGDGIAMHMSPYRQEERMHGIAEDKIKKLDKNFIEPIFEMAAQEGVTIDDLDRYLYAKHAPVRNAVIEKRTKGATKNGSGMSDKKAQEILDDFAGRGKIKSLEAIENLVRNLQEQTMDDNERYGLISPDQRKAWENLWKGSYVTLRDEEGDDAIRGVSQGYSITGPESRSALGREDGDIAFSPISGTITQAYKAIMRGEKNKVAKALYSLVQQNPELGLLDKAPKVGRLDEVTGEAVWSDGNPYGDEKAIGVKIGGKQHFVIPKDAKVAVAFKKMDQEQAIAPIRFIANLNGILARSYTTFNASFQLANLVRDIQSALLNSQSGKAQGIATRLAKNIASTGQIIAAIYNAEGSSPKSGYWQDRYKLFKESGGKVSFASMIGMEDAYGKAAAIIKKETSKGDLTLRGIHALEDIFDRSANAVENATRLAAFDAALKSGLNNAEAASFAKNLTVNFNRRGNNVNFRSLYMFSNATIQGAANAVSSIKRNPKRMAAAIGAYAFAHYAVALMSILLGGDDDEGENLYGRVPKWEREGNFVFVLPRSMQSKEALAGKERPASIPVPLSHDYGFVGPLMTFAAMKTADAFFRNPDQPKIAKGGWMKAILSTATGIVTGHNPLGKEENPLSMAAPTIFRPLTHIATNEKWFGGPVHPEKYKTDYRPNSQTFNNKEDSNAKAVAQFVNGATGGDKYVSGGIDMYPGHISEIVKGYAPLLSLGNPSALIAMNALGSVYGNVMKKVDGESLGLQDAPIISRFYKAGTPDQRDMSDYYEDRRKSEAAVWAAKAADKKGKKERAAEIRSDNADAIKRADTYKDAAKETRAINKEMKEIDNNESLSTREKREKKRELYDRRAEINRGARRKLEEAN